MASYLSSFSDTHSFLRDRMPHQISHKEPSPLLQPQPPEDCGFWKWSDVPYPGHIVMVWDPEYGMLWISGGDLAETRMIDSDSLFPREAVDFEQSSSSMFAPDTPTSASAIAWYGDTTLHNFADPHPCSEARSRHHLTQTSSTLGGHDVYVRGSLMWETHFKGKRYSFLGKLGHEFEFDPEMEFSKNRLVLNSQWEACEEPVQNRDKQQSEDEGSQFGTWTTLEAPQTPDCEDLSFPFSNSRGRRRLKKRRPPEASNPPLEVLGREAYNHLPQVDDGWLFVEGGRSGASEAE